MGPDYSHYIERITKDLNLTLKHLDALIVVERARPNPDYGNIKRMEMLVEQLCIVVGAKMESDRRFGEIMTWYAVEKEKPAPDLAMILVAEDYLRQLSVNMLALGKRKTLVISLIYRCL